MIAQTDRANILHKSYAKGEVQRNAFHARKFVEVELVMLIP